MMNIYTKKLLFLSLLLIGIDLLTKLLALNLLPFQDQIHLLGERVNLYLTYNTDSTGGQSDYLLKIERNKNLSLILASITCIILISYILFIFHKKLPISTKWIIGIGIFLLLLITSLVLKPFLINIEISNWTASVFSKIVGISIYFTLFYLSRNNTIRLFSAIIISAGLGNLINHFYPPYRVIDFIDIEGSYDLLKIGVFIPMLNEFAK